MPQPLFLCSRDSWYNNVVKYKMILLFIFATLQWQKNNNIKTNKANGNIRYLLSILYKLKFMRNNRNTLFV